ncbi:MAG: class I tRNA ligase family protein [Thermoplasmata archaeon]|nr:class I tRNA ligase family protein [Thermoplasmata archaeon]
MQPLPRQLKPPEIEASIRSLWNERSLPAEAGVVGPAEGAVTRQFLGTITGSEPTLDLAARLVCADVIARFGAERERRSIGFLEPRSSTDPALVEARRAFLDTIGCWTGKARPPGRSQEAMLARVQEMVDTLASLGLLVTRDLPFRCCPRCRGARSPETIVYRAEPGSTSLVRFPLPSITPPTSLIVWTDAPWKLLATAAVLVNAELPYVIARFRRRGVEERIALARSALPRLAAWFPDAEVEVLEERLGSSFTGLPYVHPLATEYPGLSNLAPPLGTVLPLPEVNDSGTGVVLLVPRHGAADAAASASLGIEGRTVLDADGRLSDIGRHKYTRLPVDAANAFIVRDLEDGGSIFAELTVRRGVPHCIICGSELLWIPGRAWCVEMGRLPGAIQRDFSRLLPTDPLPSATEVVSWPFSETVESVEGSAPSLLECSACDRTAPNAPPRACACGGQLRLARRNVLPAPLEAMLSWSEVDPTESTVLFVSDRRRVPTVVHHLLAREAARARPADLRLLLVPAMPVAEEATIEEVGRFPDALRAALIRAAAVGATPASIRDRCLQEARRLSKVWETARFVLDGMIRDGLSFAPEATIRRASELPEEDRAFLSRLERMGNDVRIRYERFDLAGVQERLSRFMEDELRDEYLPLVRSRLEPNTPASERAATHQLLAHVITRCAELYGPIAPFTMEAIVRGFRPDDRSMFERALAETNESLLDLTRELGYDRWVGFAAALRTARRQVGIEADATLPRVVLFVSTDALGADLLRSLPILSRIGRVTQIEVDSPGHPWPGRRIDAHPNPGEIQRVYGSKGARIVRLLELMPGRKVFDGLQAGTLTVALDGEHVPVLPPMVDFLESLPECVVPVPWQYGEILLVEPSEKSGAPIPALSLDGFGVARHIRHRIRRAGAHGPPERVVIAASGHLADQLDHQAEAVAGFLGVPRIEIVPPDEEFPAGERSTGRTRRGERWTVWIPGVPNAIRTAKRRPLRSGIPRFRTPEPETDGIDLLGEAAKQEYEAVATLTENLQAELGRPLVGPSKMTAAWTLGFRDVPDFEAASFDSLSSVPGFGPAVAGEIVRHFGGTPPPVFHHAAATLVPQPSRTSAPTPPAQEPARAAPILEQLPEPARNASPVLPPRIEILSVPPVEPPSVSTPLPRGPAPIPIEPAPAELAPPAPEPPPEIPAEPPPPPEPVGGVFVYSGNDADGAWPAFLEATADGRPGFCLTREPPGARRASIGRRRIDLVWLSNVPIGLGTPVARPSDLDGLEFGLLGTLQEKRAAFVFLEGLEYLVRLHGTERVAAFVAHVDAVARTSGARVFVPLHPGLMAPGEFDRLESAILPPRTDPPA